VFFVCWRDCAHLTVPKRVMPVISDGCAAQALERQRLRSELNAKLRAYQRQGRQHQKIERQRVKQAAHGPLISEYTKQRLAERYQPTSITAVTQTSLHAPTSRPIAATVAGSYVVVCVWYVFAICVSGVPSVSRHTWATKREKAYHHRRHRRCRTAVQTPRTTSGRCSC
jgi:hypothetical protein